MIEQVPDQQQIVQRSVDLWGKIISLQPPSQAEYADYLQSMPVAIAMVLLICGVVYLFQGWKTFKMLVIVNAAILGAFVGYELGGMLPGQRMPLFGGVAGALLLSVLAWPMMKLAVGLMAGIAGGLLGSAMWSYVATVVGRADVAQNAWAGGLIGLVTLGLLSFVIFKLVIMIFTSLQGAVMCTSGLLAILMHFEFLRMDIHDMVSGQPHLLMLILTTPAVIGFALQYTAMSKKIARKRKATEQG